MMGRWFAWALHSFMLAHVMNAHALSNLLGFKNG
jgi:hypothetical protein